MTVDLPVSPDTEARIRAAAARRGLTVCDFVLQAVVGQLPADDRRAYAAELFAGWAADAAAGNVSDEEAAADLEVLRALDANRKGGRRLFPNGFGL